MRRYMDALPIFVLSAASIDNSIPHQKYREVRDASLASLHQLRDSLRSVSKRLERNSSDPSIYLGSIFDLLDIIDLFAIGAEETLKKIENKLPEIARLVDSIANNEADFDKRKPGLLEAFRTILQKELESQLQKIAYENIVRFNTSGIDLGNPSSLFRWMVDNSQQAVLNIFSDSLVGIFNHLGQYIDQYLIAAYREYVNIQDDAIQSEFGDLLFKPDMGLRPLSTTVDYSAKDILYVSQTPTIYSISRELLERFAGWYLRNQCEFDARRGQKWMEVYNQMLINVQRTIEAFMLAYVCEDEIMKLSYVSHICVAGEPTYWQYIKDHISKLDDVLATQVQITKWKFGLYQNKVFFISHRSEFSQYVNELLSRQQSTQRLIFELA
jgi:hypothetical protein